MRIGLDGERKIHVPIRGKHVQPAPVYAYSARWYEEQGLKLPPDTRLKKFARWMRRTAAPIFELDRKERYLRLWRLSIWWEVS